MFPRVLRTAALLAPLWLVTSAVSAEDSAAPEPAPAEVEQLPTFELAPSAAATPVPSPRAAASSSVLSEASVLERARALSLELRSVEGLIGETELARSKVRRVGPAVGTYVSYGVTGVMWLGALIAMATANSIEDGLRTGDIDLDLDDTDGDGDVDMDDARRTRRVGRAMVLASVVPLGLGLFSCLLYGQRLKESRRLSHKLSQLKQERRSLIDKLGATLDVGAGHAALQLGVRL